MSDADKVLLLCAGYAVFALAVGLGTFALLCKYAGRGKR